MTVLSKTCAAVLLTLGVGVQDVAGRAALRVRAVERAHTGAFLQKQQPIDADDMGGYEYGDREVHARDSDSSDYSAEQFLKHDDARDAIDRTADESADTEMRRQAAEASEDDFGNEDTPSTEDDFVQLSSKKHHAKRAGKQEPMDADDMGGYEYGDREVHARDADSSDYSAEQFLKHDDARDAIDRTADESADTEMRRQAAEASEDDFGNEDTPSTEDDFVQLSSKKHHAKRAGKQQPMDADDMGGYEYGDREVHARDADSSDYSAEQFLKHDDARDAIDRTADESADTEMRRQAAEASEDDFGNEDTPSTEDD